MRKGKPAKDNKEKINIRLNGEFLFKNLLNKIILSKKIISSFSSFFSIKNNKKMKQLNIKLAYINI
jgi:hypothetical protein